MVAISFVSLLLVPASLRIKSSRLTYDSHGQILSSSTSIHPRHLRKDSLKDISVNVAQGTFNSSYNREVQSLTNENQSAIDLVKGKARISRKAGVKDASDESLHKIVSRPNSPPISPLIEIVLQDIPQDFTAKTQSNANKKQVKTVRKIRNFLKAGVKDIPRIVHSTLGLLSLLVGLHHMVDILFINTFSKFIKVPTVICTGMLHGIVGLFGIRRLNFKQKKESARNAMFWPAPIQSTWLTFASLSEWGQGSNALISMWNIPFAGFTIFNLLLTLWQLSEVMTKTGTTSITKDTIWFKNSAKNALCVEFSYLLWMQIQMGALLYITCTVPRLTFSTFMNTFPNMQSLLANLALNTAFFNNLAIFIATLLRYKILSKPNLDNKIVFSVPLVSSILIVWKVFSCFLGSYGGAMSASFFSLIFK